MARVKLSKLQWGLIKTPVSLICLLPFAFITWDAVNNLLGADPIQTLHFRTGDWTLRFLLITLTMSPLQKGLKSPIPIRFRRMFGLFTYFYASLHLLVWLVLDQSLSIDNMINDVPESPYIILGLTAYCLLTPLALTSTAGMMRRLGNRWTVLHRLIYLIAILGVTHFFWLTKLDYQEPLIYAFVLVILFIFRWPMFKKLLAPKPTNNRVSS
ncbi:MAG: sulfoxide reductase heme-binding subunit YedZ [Cycloclasticus sp. symbiont of Poecilosclerida sp. M]|nr:MAG: sulfoxide reductase heme-binding subunit YedZ [Cycloclasticus sp. symbiont of Poecilosclerida sp. M]